MYSKGKVLTNLVSMVSIFKIPDLLCFSVADYYNDENRIAALVNDKFRGKQLAIRSSAYDEDSKSTSLAGEYASVLNVIANDAKSVNSAFDVVVKSFTKNRSYNKDDEVIVQEMITNSSMSGVIFTYELNTGAPYYVINYDDVSGSTDTVTSGDGKYSNRTLYIHRGSLELVKSERFYNLILAVQELEQIMENKFLDIEFALGDDLTPYLLQVRAITTQPNWNRAVAKRIDAALKGIQSFVKVRLQPIPGVYGNTTVLGQMPDWNPAEMIGRAPRALALSLYKALITNDAWRTAREIMGYDVPKGQPLMISLAGQPFIDTRLSFHSYLPDGLSPEISKKLVNAWVKNCNTILSCMTKLNSKWLLRHIALILTGKLLN